MGTYAILRILNRVVDELRDALYDKNLRQLDRVVEKLVSYVISFYDTSEKYENLYHMLWQDFFLRFRWLLYN